MPISAALGPNLLGRWRRRLVWISLAALPSPRSIEACAAS
jgi:hypothetical protein